MGVYLPFTPRLPSAYQEVEYIQSSGTQWIDTGVTATQNTKSQIKFMNLEYTGDVIYGLYNSNDNTDYRFFNKYNNDVNIGAAIFDFKSSRILSGTNTILTNVVYELELGNYYVKNIETGTNIVSGTAISSYTSPRTITLNNYNNSTYSKNRWYYVKIYNGSTLQRDFVPCYRKSDNVIGLYDLANNQFYTNSGTGTFTKGADVTTTDLKNAYIGEYRVPGANTVAYWKYENNLNDSSWNNHTLSNYNSISYSTNPYAVNLSTSNYLYFNNTDFNHDWTFNTWVYLTNRNVSTAGTAIMSQGSGGTYHVLYISMNYYGVLGAGVFGSDLAGDIQTPLNQRINICVTFNYTTKNLKSFINGVKDIDSTLTSSYSVPSGNFIMGGLADNPGDRNWKIQGRLSNTILEASEWDEALPQIYYNQMKSNYGL